MGMSVGSLTRVEPMWFSFGTGLCDNVRDLKGRPLFGLDGLPLEGIHLNEITIGLVSIIPVEDSSVLFYLSQVSLASLHLFIATISI
jgi:hypothetical protein